MHRNAEPKVRRNKQRKVRRINACRLRLEQGKEEALALERKVMTLQQEHLLLKQSLRRKKRSVSKATTIFPSSVINNYREKYAIVVTALKHKVPCFKKIDITFNGKEIGDGTFGFVTSGYIDASNQKFAVKIFRKDSSATSVSAEDFVYAEMPGHRSFP